MNYKDKNKFLNKVNDFESMLDYLEDMQLNQMNLLNTKENEINDLIEERKKINDLVKNLQNQIIYLSKEFLKMKKEFDSFKTNFFNFQSKNKEELDKKMMDFYNILEIKDKIKKQDDLINELKKDVE